MHVWQLLGLEYNMKRQLGERVDGMKCHTFLRDHSRPCAHARRARGVSPDVRGTARRRANVWLSRILGLALKKLRLSAFWSEAPQIRLQLQFCSLGPSERTKGRWGGKERRLYKLFWNEKSVELESETKAWVLRAESDWTLCFHTPPTDVLVSVPTLSFFPPVPKPQISCPLLFSLLPADSQQAPRRPRISTPCAPRLTTAGSVTRPTSLTGPASLVPSLWRQAVVSPSSRPWPTAVFHPTGSSS